MATPLHADIVPRRYPWPERQAGLPDISDWGAYVEARLVDAPGRTEPAHAWVSPRAGLSVRLPTFAR